MAEELEIRDVQISPPRLLEPDIERGEQQPVVDISVEVRNRSADKTLHAISSLRTLSYDSATKTLSLGFREPEPNSDFPLPHILPPQVTSIPPGETRALEVTVPVVIKEIQPSDQWALNVSTYNISELEHVTCTVSYNETPFETRSTESGVEMVKRLQEWGQAVEGTFERTLPN